MRVRIHRGTKQIGGTCVELTASGARLILDYGLPLDGDPFDPALIPEVASDDLLGVVISHPHLDHYGLLHQLPKGVPVVMGAAGRRIVQAAMPFTGQPAPQLDGFCLADRAPLKIGPFCITPYLVDHSAYDSYAILVEAEGKRLFYSGDFRAHGRKARLYERLISNPPKGIDVLLMEGSSLSRLDALGAFPTEGELETALMAQLEAAPGVTLFHTSSQNIDRVVTLYRACRRVGKPLVIDLYTAAVLAATGNANIPQAGWPDIMLYVPRKQAVQVKRNKWFDLLQRHARNRVYADQLPSRAAHAVFLFRPILMDDLEKMGCMGTAHFIYSQWRGYLENGSYSAMEGWLARHGVAISHLHTSGHASPRDLRRFAEAISPKALVPIHSFATGKYPELFEHVVFRDDGEWWEA